MRSIINAKFAVLFVHIIVVGSIFITKVPLYSASFKTSPKPLPPQVGTQ